MALTASFLATCRDAIDDLAELTAYRAALVPATHTRAGRIAAWHATNSSTTTTVAPVYALRVAIRRVVNAQADASGALGPLDRESAYTTLAGEYTPAIDRPESDAVEAAALATLLQEDQLT